MGALKPHRRVAQVAPSGSCPAAPIRASSRLNRLSLDSCSQKINAKNAKIAKTAACQLINWLRTLLTLRSRERDFFP